MSTKSLPRVLETYTWYEVYVKLAGRWMPFDQHHYPTRDVAREHAWTGPDCQIVHVTTTVRATRDQEEE